MRVQRLVGRGMQRRKIPAGKSKRNLLEWIGMRLDEMSCLRWGFLGVLLKQEGSAVQQHRIRELDRAAGIERARRRKVN